MSRVRFARSAGSALLLVLALFAFAVPRASASHTKKLYEFCALAACADGENPIAPLVRDAAGNLYGTTLAGGDGGEGTVFELVKSKRKMKYRRLYSFCRLAACADGAKPRNGLVIDGEGNLYGTATEGGANGAGIVFELVAQKKLKVLYDACATENCADGSRPHALTYQGASSGVPYDGTSALYGGNANGGVNDSGTIFRLQRNGKHWSMKTLYRFCTPDCSTGRFPVHDLYLDGAGNLFGTASGDDGTLYTIDGAGNATLLHRFCVQANCIDGQYPSGGVTGDAAGVLYGTATSGGQTREGVVYRYDPASGYSVVGEFCNSCGRGSSPAGTPVLDASGNLFGTTTYGGPDMAGSIYQVGGGTLVSLTDFCGTPECGHLPTTGLVIDGSGNLFGTTKYGGANGSGTVFEFSP